MYVICVQKMIKPETDWAFLILFCMSIASPTVEAVVGALHSGQGHPMQNKENKTIRQSVIRRTSLADALVREAELTGIDRSRTMFCNAAVLPSLGVIMTTATSAGVGPGSTVSATAPPSALLTKADTFLGMNSAAPTLIDDSYDHVPRPSVWDSLRAFERSAPVVACEPYLAALHARVARSAAGTDSGATALLQHLGPSPDDVISLMACDGALEAPLAAVVEGVKAHRSRDRRQHHRVASSPSQTGDEPPTSLEAALLQHSATMWLRGRVIPMMLGGALPAVAAAAVDNSVVRAARALATDVGGAADTADDDGGPDDDVIARGMCGVGIEALFGRWGGAAGDGIDANDISRHCSGDNGAENLHSLADTVLYHDDDMLPMPTARFPRLPLSHSAFPPPPSLTARPQATAAAAVAPLPLSAAAAASIGGAFASAPGPINGAISAPYVGAGTPTPMGVGGRTDGGAQGYDAVATAVRGAASAAAAAATAAAAMPTLFRSEHAQLQTRLRVAVSVGALVDEEQVATAAADGGWDSVERRSHVATSPEAVSREAAVSMPITPAGGLAVTVGRIGAPALSPDTNGANGNVGRSGVATRATPLGRPHVPRAKTAHGGAVPTGASAGIPSPPHRTTPPTGGGVISRDVLARLRGSMGLAATPRNQLVAIAPPVGMFGYDPVPTRRPRTTLLRNPAAGDVSPTRGRGALAGTAGTQADEFGAVVTRRGRPGTDEPARATRAAVVPRLRPDAADTNWLQRQPLRSDPVANAQALRGLIPDGDAAGADVSVLLPPRGISASPRGAATAAAAAASAAHGGPSLPLSTVVAIQRSHERAAVAAAAVAARGRATGPMEHRVHTARTVITEPEVAYSVRRVVTGAYNGRKVLDDLGDTQLESGFRRAAIRTSAPMVQGPITTAVV